MALTGETGLIALLAHPVAHVKAPAFMNPLFESFGHDLFLFPLHVAPADLASAVSTLRRAHNVRGVVLTIPHKEAMARLCDALGPDGRLAGAVNAVRFEPDRLVGDMFDGIGLLAAQRVHGIEITGRRVLLVGAGGAGRAIAFAFAAAGASALGIANRTPARAERLAAEVASAASGVEVSVAGADPAGWDVVVNATSLGLHEGDALPCAVETLAPATDVVDVIAVRDTELMREAARRGCRVLGGRPMAEAQVAAFARFFQPHRGES